jgi:hypothetical protein
LYIFFLFLYIFLNFGHFFPGILDNTDTHPIIATFLPSGPSYPPKPYTSTSQPYTLPQQTTPLLPFLSSYSYGTPPQSHPPPPLAPHTRNSTHTQHPLTPGHPIPPLHVRAHVGAPTPLEKKNHKPQPRHLETSQLTCAAHTSSPNPTHTMS